MSDNPMFLAVRRNLQPGFVAFKQEGSRLLYTLDNVTWQTAFDYSRFITQPNVSDGITPQQVLDILRIALKNSPNANPYNFFPADMKAVGIEAERGDCVAAGYVAELFVDFWNEAAKAEYEGTFSDATGIIEEALTLLFQVVLLTASTVAKGTVVGIPVGIALDGLSLVAPLAAEFYAGVSVGAFRAIYEALGGGATPPIHPLMVNEVKCVLIEQLKTARTIGNFQTISGALIPESVADAWNAFATLEMWTLFNTMSVVVDKNESFCCGESCYAIPPAAMNILNATYNAASWVSSEVVGQYLKSKKPVYDGVSTALGQEAVYAESFYPFDPVAGNKIKNVRVVLDTVTAPHSGPGSIEIRLWGITLDNQAYAFTAQSNGRGLNQYTFTPQPLIENTLFKGIRVYASCTLITNSASVFDASSVTMRAVEVCLSD